MGRTCHRRRFWWSKASFRRTWPAPRDTSLEVISTFHLPLNGPNRKFPNARNRPACARHAHVPVPVAPAPARREASPTPMTRRCRRRWRTGESAFSEHPTDTKNRPEQNPYVPYDPGARPGRFVPTGVCERAALAQRPAVGWVGPRPGQDLGLAAKVANAACPQKWFVLADPKNVKCPFATPSAGRDPVVETQTRTR